MDLTEATDMKKLMIALMVAGAFAVGCGGEKSGASGSGAAAGGDKTGIQACDDYIAKYEACISKMDPAAKAAAEPAFKAQRDGFKQSAAAAKEATENACKAALASLPPNCK